MLVNALESCAGKVEMRKGNTTDKNAQFFTKLILHVHVFQYTCLTPEHPKYF